MLAKHLRSFPRLRIPPRRWLLRALGVSSGLILITWLALVVIGSNHHSVVPGQVYRSAQLSGKDLSRTIERRGIKTVINLRGFSPGFDWYQQEAEATALAGINQEDITLSANRLPPPQELRRLIEILDNTQYPILIHCKQGADRTGLVSALVKLLFTDCGLSEGRRELWPHRGHVPFGRVLAMDEFFDRYEAWLAVENQTHNRALFRKWVLTVYQPGVAASSLTWDVPPPKTIVANKTFLLKVNAVNRSGDNWRFTPGRTAGIHLRYSLWRAGDPAPLYQNEAGLFERNVKPGETIGFDLGFPRIEQPGQYILRAELIDYRGAGVDVRSTAFVQFGDEPLLETLTVQPGGE